MTPKPYVMNRSRLLYYAKNGKFPICANQACGLAIKEGEWVQPVYITNNHKKHTKLYHLDCYEAIYIDA